MNFDRLTAYLDTLSDAYGIPACDCAITQGHKTLYRHLCGKSSGETDQFAQTSDLYRLFSASKLITMIAVLQLKEKGQLSLLDNASAYLPEYQMMQVADDFVFNRIPVRWPAMDAARHWAHRGIRILDLMTMTAGMSYDLQAEPIAALRREKWSQATTREVVAAMAAVPLLYEPATHWAYSLAHDVLGAVVEVASGQSFGDYLDQHIFAPLGIEKLYFHLDDALRARVSPLYMMRRGSDVVEADDGQLSDSFQVTRQYESGGAGLIGTVDSYSAVMEALACGGVGRSGERILSEKSVAMFTVPYTHGALQEDFAATGKKGYSYGLGVRVLTDATAARSPIGEFGWDGAAGAYALVDTQNQVSLFYAQHVMGCVKAFYEIHPMLRDLLYEALQTR
jgi:CubicO group peptidase (beta-lactamase class C family)